MNMGTKNQTNVLQKIHHLLCFEPLQAYGFLGCLWRLQAHQKSRTNHVRRHFLLPPRLAFVHCHITLGSSFAFVGPAASWSGKGDIVLKAHMFGKDVGASEGLIALCRG